MSHLSQKFSKLWPFSWVKYWWNLKSVKFSNIKISLTFWDLDQFFFLVKSIYISESTHKVSRSNNNLEPLNWVWALCAPPLRGITRTQNPGANRVKLFNNTLHVMRKFSVHMNSLFLLLVFLSNKLVWNMKQVHSRN